jgi:hypothetical protein
MVFPEDLQHFTAALGEAVEFLSHYRPSGATPAA